MIDEQTIKARIRSKFPKTSFPTAIDFKLSENGKSIEILLNWKNIISENMQVVGNAFEGWAIAVYLGMDKQYDIKLGVKGDGKFSFEDYPHMARFLYRAMRFSEQYVWFQLSHDLEIQVKEFKTFLEEGTFVNNVPMQEANSIEEADDSIDINENIVESKLAEKGILSRVLGDELIGSGIVYRQLPVGLFKENKSKDTSVFTYGHSAIDLWNINNDTFNVIELKTNNRMLGIITEIFFYSNYIYDLLLGKSNFCLQAPKGEFRGYDKLYENKDKVKRIKGILLADDMKYHPCVTEETIGVLSNNKDIEIEYVLKSYHVEKMDIVICR